MGRALARVLVILALAGAVVGSGGVASAAPATVTGRVVGDGSVPFEGAHVVALDSSATEVANTDTDVNGEFSLQLEEGDTYTIVASAPGYVANVSPEVSVDDTSPQDVSTIVLRVPGQITGSVSVPPGYDTEVTVRAYLPFSNTHWDAVTEPDGSYVIDGVVGSVFVVEFDPTDPDLIQEYYSDVYVPPVAFVFPPLVTGVPSNGVANASLEVGRTIAGTVTGPGGAPVLGAQVKASVPFGSNTAPVGTTELTDASGHYVIHGVPPASTGTAPGPSSVTVRATPPFGLNATAGTAGPFSVSAGVDVTGADIQLPGLTVGTAQLFNEDGSLYTPVMYDGPAVCASPGEFVLATLSCSDGRPFLPFSARPATSDYSVGPIPAGDYTARGISFLTGEAGPVATFHVELGDTFHCDLPLSALSPVVADCEVTSVNAGDGDGVDDALEGAAPNGGDGNDDGIPDADQADVASLPIPGGGGEYLTIAIPADDLRDLALTDVAIATAPPPPSGLQLETGLISFGVAGLTPGDSVDVEIILSAGTSANAYWKYEVGVGWYDASSLATFNGDVITLHLTDGGPGDADHTQDGKIDDPGAPAIELFSFGGFQSPIDAMPTVNQATAGSTVPLKWRLLDREGVPVSDPESFVSATFRPRPCASTVYDPVEFDAPSVGLKYQGNGEWQLGWKTNKLWTGCGDLEVRLADGSVHRAAFTLK